MYAFRVSPHVENLIKECAARLITSGVPVSQSVFFFECGGSSRFGYCKKGDAKGASGFEYSIAINKYIVNDKDISDTVAHELLHTIKTAKNHDANWKYWANFVSRNTPFTITVRANIKLQPAAYKNNSRKKVFPVEQYDENTMNILECPLCHDKIAVKKTVKPDKYGQSEYLCRKCHKPYFFTVPSPSVAYVRARKTKTRRRYYIGQNNRVRRRPFFENNALCHQKSLQQTVYILFHDLPRNRELKLAAARKIPLFPCKIRHIRRIQVFQINSKYYEKRSIK